MGPRRRPQPRGGGRPRSRVARPAGAQAHFVADLVSFSRGQGVYVGLNLDGTVASIADDWNQLYYGKSVQATDILVRVNVHNDQARELLNVIAKAARNPSDVAGGKK